MLFDTLSVEAHAVLPQEDCKGSTEFEGWINYGGHHRLLRPCSDVYCWLDHAILQMAAGLQGFPKLFDFSMAQATRWRVWWLRLQIDFCMSTMTAIGGIKWMQFFLAAFRLWWAEGLSSVWSNYICMWVELSSVPHL
jgi:hypothetical protein